MRINAIRKDATRMLLENIINTFSKTKGKELDLSMFNRYDMDDTYCFICSDDFKISFWWEFAQAPTNYDLNTDFEVNIGINANSKNIEQFQKLIEHREVIGEVIRFYCIVG